MATNMAQRREDREKREKQYHDLWATAGRLIEAWEHGQLSYDELMEAFCPLLEKAKAVRPVVSPREGKPRDVAFV